jgi:undecaprenyl-diphosphatase
MNRVSVSLSVVICAGLVAPPALAQGPAAPSPSPPASAVGSVAAPSPPAEEPKRPLGAALATELTPKPVEAKPIDTLGGQKTQFVADPVGDGGVLAVSLGIVGVLSLIQSTGEIRPQQPATNAKVLSIDRLAIDQKPSKGFATASNVGLFAAGAFAVIDPVLSARRDGLSAGFVDAVLYAESVAITVGVTDIAKMAIRRPRPSAYAEQARIDKAYAGQATRPDITSTDSALSFFSGHTSTVATIGATATYLAFSRAPKGSARPWITLGAFTALTGLVGVARVRAGNHFPTDVFAGAMAGAGIGALVPHLHRSDSAKSRPVWIGFSPDGVRTGGVLTASGSF